MKKVTLTQGYFAQVDDEDYDKVKCYTWCCQNRPNERHHAATYIDGKYIYMHNIVMQDQLKDGLTVDHKDRDGLNNQKYNLRMATPSQQLMNTEKRCGSVTSNYKGVYYRKDANVWRARIQCNGLVYNLGHFYTQEAAAHAYNLKAKKFFGEFANLNEIKEVIA